MNHKPSDKLLLGAAISACLAIPVNTYAQLEEVVVTARQRTESLADVPAAITAFTENDIERAGIERAGDFLNLTPGVNLTNTAEVGDTQVSIRGINGARDGETNFAFIVDGILYTNPSAFNREFADVSQIEVLKGPQGAIYGRSASAGAIITTTRSPSMTEFEGFVKGQVGRDSTYFGQVAASGPLIENQLAGRISFDYRTTDGTRHNNFLAKDVVDDFENYNVNGRLLWEPTENFKADAKFRYGEVDAAAIAFNAALALNNFGFNAADVNDHDFVFSPNVDPKNEQEIKEFSLKVDYDMDWATVTAWTLYSDIDQWFIADGTSGAFGFFFNEPGCQASTAGLAGFPVQPPFGIGPTPGTSFFPPYGPTTCDGGQYQERNQEDISFEIRLTSASDQRLRWMAGFYFLDLEREVGVAQTTDIAALGGAQSIRSFDDPQIEALSHDQFDTTVYSVFGGIDYDITDTIAFSFNLRWDREEREVSNLIDPTRRSNFIDYTNGSLNALTGNLLPDDGMVGSPLNPAFVNFDTGVISTAPLADRKEVFEEVQPKVSLTWDMTDDWTWFASWGVGFKSGGFNNQGSQVVINQFVNPNLTGITDVYDKETSSNFEIGFKSTWLDGRAKLEATIYHTEVDDMQFFEFFVGPFGLQRVVQNVDEVTIVGGETAWTIAISDWLTWDGSAAIVNGKIDENSIRPQTEGNEVPFAPEWTFNTGLTMVKPAFANVDFVGRLDYRYTGETFFHVVQSDVTPALLFDPSGGLQADFTTFKRDGFSTVNLRVGLEAQDGKWAVTGTVRNLLNEQFLEEVITAVEFGGAFVHPGAQRTWALEAVYRF